MSEDAGGGNAPTNAPIDGGAAPITPEGQTTSGGGESSQPWYSGVADEGLRGLAEQKQWTSMDQALDSYRNLEKMRGIPESELLRIPKAEDADGMSDMYNRLGRPTDAKGYDIGVEHGAETEFLFDMFHKAGLNNDQAKQVHEQYDSWLDQRGQQHQDNATAQSQVDMDDLKREWGSAYDATMDAAKRAVNRLGVTKEQLAGIESGMGTKGMMQLFANFGKATGEMGSLSNLDTTSGDGFRGMTPEAARSKYESLNADPDFKARLFSKDDRVRQKAMQERSNISKMAFDH